MNTDPTPETPTLTRAELLARLEDLRPHFHLLEPGDVPVRLALCIPGTQSSLPTYRVSVHPKPVTFRRKGKVFVLEFDSQEEFLRMQEKIVATRPTFRLWARVEGYGVGVKPAPVIAAQAASASPATVAAPRTDSPASARVEVPASPDPGGMRSAREADLRRMPEHYVYARYVELWESDPRKPKLTFHNLKAAHIAAILDLEFPAAPVGLSAPAPSPKVERVEPVAVVPVVPAPEGYAFDEADPSTWSHAALSDLKWERLKALAASRGVMEKSREKVVDALLALTLAPA